jgi:hypothetical protein
MGRNWGSGQQVLLIKVVLGAVVATGTYIKALVQSNANTKTNTVPRTDSCQPFQLSG